MLDSAIEQIARNKDTIEIARNAADIERIRAAGKMAAVLDIEGSFDLDGDPGVLRDMYRLGMRSVQLSAHNWTSNYADSCCSPVKWHGLNDRGREFIREMNRLGMLINVSHASDEAIGQAIDTSTAAGGGDASRAAGDQRYSAQYAGCAAEETGGKGRDHRLSTGQRVSQSEGVRLADAARRQAVLGHDRDSGARHEAEHLRAGPDCGAAISDAAGGHPGRYQDDGGRLGGGGRPRGATGGRGPRVAGQRFRRRSAAAARDAGRSRPADDHRGDAAPGYSEQRIRKFLGLNLLRVFRQVTEKK